MRVFSWSWVDAWHGVGPVEMGVDVAVDVGVRIGITVVVLAADVSASRRSDISSISFERRFRGIVISSLSWNWTRSFVRDSSASVIREICAIV